MKILRSDLAHGHELEGAVVVIDVLRAFTTAAYAFAAGARAMINAPTSPRIAGAETTTSSVRIPQSDGMGRRVGWRIHDRLVDEMDPPTTDEHDYRERSHEHRLR